jgi:hypothetical protein
VALKIIHHWYFCHGYVWGYLLMGWLLTGLGANGMLLENCFIIGGPNDLGAVVGCIKPFELSCTVTSDASTARVVRGNGDMGFTTPPTTCWPDLFSFYRLQGPGSLFLHGSCGAAGTGDALEGGLSLSLGQRWHLLH